MDTTQTTTHVGLCAGYGGIELGLKRVIRNLRSVALCEIEAFACANLVAKMEAGLMDPAPIWSNLKTFPWAEFRDQVDILTGGYPCQPFSAAGKRLGSNDDRHLWPFISAGIALMRPRICFFENVEGHISLGLSDVLQDLGGMGYRATWGIFSAAETGAPHQRKRVFILAHRNDAVLEGWNGAILRQCAGELPSGTGSASSWPSGPKEQQRGWEPPRVVENSKRGGVKKPTHKQPNSHSKPSCRNRRQQAEPTLGGDADGPAGRMDYAELCVSCDNRTDELRLLGNGVVPATAELAFRTLIKELIA